MTVGLEYERGKRRAQLPKRQTTPGARTIELTRTVDYGGDVGEVDETYARQLVVDVYPPGSEEPVTVTEKAWWHIYRTKGYTLKPGEVGETAAAPVDVETAQSLEAALAEADAETAAERQAREAAEVRERELARELADTRKAAEAREAERERELAELREQLSRQSEEPALAGASEPARAGGKAK